LPCLKRHGIGPIGVFTNASTDKIEIKTTFVIIPHDDPSAMTQNREVIQSDEEYQNDAAVFFTHGNQEKSYERISSELLVAMQCWPKVKVPAGILANKNRVYELRTYESANEKLGQLKVEMFNNGEVPIFIDCGIISHISRCIQAKMHDLRHGTHSETIRRGKFLVRLKNIREQLARFINMFWYQKLIQKCDKLSQSA
jgi:hypothetical protein